MCLKVRIATLLKVTDSEALITKSRCVFLMIASLFVWYNNRLPLAALGIPSLYIY